MPTDREILRRSRERRKKRRLAKFIFWLMLAGLLFYLSILFFSWSALRLEKVRVEGNYTVSEEAIVRRAKELLAGKIWGLYARDHLFLWSESSIATALAEDFPRLKTVRLSHLGRQTLLVRVEERVPAFSRCRDFGPDGEPASCELIDETGRSCGPSPVFSEAIYPILEGDFVADAEGQLLTSASFGNLAVFISALRRDLTAEMKPLGLVRIVSLGNDDYAALVALSGEPAAPWRIIFNIKTASGELLDNFRAVFRSELFRAELEKNAWKLDYLDLRFGRKVFYKFR